MKNRIQQFLLLAVTIFIVSCEPEVTDKPLLETSELAGTWRVTETTEVYKSINTYDAVILATGTTSMNISNFYGLGSASKVNALVDGAAYTVTMTKQTFDNNFILVKGSGTISDDAKTIRFYYEIDDNSGIVDKVDATYEKIQ